LRSPAFLRLDESHLADDFDERLDAALEVIVSKLFRHGLHADEAADGDLGKQIRIDVAVDRSLPLRFAELFGRLSHPDTERTADLIVKLGVTAEIVDQSPQPCRPFAPPGEPAKRAWHGKKAVDGADMARGFRHHLSGPAPLVVVDDRKGERGLGREMKIETTLGQTRSADDLVERCGIAAFRKDR
jgi:hypothetical protein